MKYEYKKVDLGHLFTSISQVQLNTNGILNDHGKEGWRLVSAVEYNGNAYGFFERPLKEDKE